ncbi:regulatory protein RecX [Pseudoalteromonas sp. B193]
MLDWCEKHNFINEQRYCEGFVRKHIFKCHGLKRIQSEAWAKGLIVRCLRVVEELEIDWFELAQDAYNKKYSIHRQISITKIKLSVRYLMYRGFSYDEINFAMQAQ